MIPIGPKNGLWLECLAVALQAIAKDTAVHVLEEAQPPSRAESMNFLRYTLK